MEVQRGHRATQLQQDHPLPRLEGCQAMKACIHRAAGAQSPASLAVRGESMTRARERKAPQTVRLVACAEQAAGLAVGDIACRRAPAGTDLLTDQAVTLRAVLGAPRALPACSR